MENKMEFSQTIVDRAIKNGQCLLGREKGL